MNETVTLSIPEKLKDIWGEKLHPTHCSLTALACPLNAASTDSMAYDETVLLGVGYILEMCDARIDKAMENLDEIMFELKEEAEGGEPPLQPGQELMEK